MPSGSLYGHKCAVPDCNKVIDSKLLMCLRHWRQVPADLKVAVWRGYRAGMGPEYDVAVAAAVDAVLERNHA